MSKKKKKNKITEAQADTAVPENTSKSAASEESAESVSEISAGTSENSSAEAEASADKKTGDEFDEHKITESENRRLHERFRFDWELEENILEALDEDASDLTEPEETEPEPIQVRSISFSQAAQAIFGLFILVFSIIGVVATCLKVSDFIKAQKDNSAQIEYLEDYLMPLVATDAPIFDGAASLNEDVVISAACWDIILNPSVYYEHSGGAYSVSYLDVDRRITKLFGTGLTYTHKTVGDVEMIFEYDSESGMYSIPSYPRSPAYYPVITSITEVENGLELTVGYKLAITNWIDSADNTEKTMIYTVVPTETDYNITAIRIGEIGSSEDT